MAPDGRGRSKSCRTWLMRVIRSKPENGIDSTPWMPASGSRLDRVLGNGQHDDRDAEPGVVDLLDELHALDPALEQRVDEDDVRPELLDLGDDLGSVGDHVEELDAASARSAGRGCTAPPAGRPRRGAGASGHWMPSAECTKPNGRPHLARTSRPSLRDGGPPRLRLIEPRAGGPRGSPGRRRARAAPGRSRRRSARPRGPRRRRSPGARRPTRGGARRAGPSGRPARPGGPPRRSWSA